MSDRPALPRFHPCAIVLEPHEMQAIKDAWLLYDLLTDGETDTALALIDQANDGGHVAGTRLALNAVRAKIEKAEAPERRKIREWLRDRGLIDQA